MKTLFIQTHELASKLSPKHYMCCQLSDILKEKLKDLVYSNEQGFEIEDCNEQDFEIEDCNEQGFEIEDSASLVILALLREQKEYFLDLDPVDMTEYSSPYFYTKGRIEINGFFMSDLLKLPERNRGSKQSAQIEIRQRLINSLLTRPDRTLCVLIPE